MLLIWFNLSQPYHSFGRSQERIAKNWCSFICLHSHRQALRAKCQPLSEGRSCWDMCRYRKFVGGWLTALEEGQTRHFPPRNIWIGASMRLKFSDVFSHWTTCMFVAGTTTTQLHCDCSFCWDIAWLDDDVVNGLAMYYLCSKSLTGIHDLWDQLWAPFVVSNHPSCCPFLPRKKSCNIM